MDTPHPTQPLPNAEPEPRWPALAAVLATGALFLFMPERLTFGPNWLLLVAVLILSIPTLITRRMGSAKLNYLFGLLLSGVITCALVWSLGTLIAGLPAKKENPTELLTAAVALWISNILVFACWYWRLDAGGPNERDLRRFHTDGAFLFPQMTLPVNSKLIKAHWRPGFVDYLFLAFNTSTAFSPTDVPVLSRWAKLLMMVQSSISLGTLAILAARAINIL
jgi:hypothetical protein